MRTIFANIRIEIKFTRNCRRNCFSTGLYNRECKSLREISCKPKRRKIREKGSEKIAIENSWFTESVAFAAIRQRAPSLSPSVKRRECSSKRVHSLPWLKEKRSSEGKGEIERNEIKTRNEILCKFIGREERGGGRGSTSDERRRGISDGVKI